MFHSLKGKFLLVQDGISASIRGFKVKDGQSSNAKVSSLNYRAGTEIVLKNEVEWKEIHSLFEENAQKAEKIDKIICDVHSKMNNQLRNIHEITNFLGNIQKFSKKVESISNMLESIGEMAEKAERVLIIFEDLIETEELKQKELNEKIIFAEYCHKKSREADLIKKKLEEEHYAKLSLEEKKIEDVQKERQELFSMAFQQDMELYKESGIVPKFRSNDPSSGISIEDVVIEDDLKDLNELLES